MKCHKCGKDTSDLNESIFIEINNECESCHKNAIGYYDLGQVKKEDVFKGHEVLYDNFDYVTNVYSGLKIENIKNVLYSQGFLLASKNKRSYIFIVQIETEHDYEKVASIRFNLEKGEYPQYVINNNQMNVSWGGTIADYEYENVSDVSVLVSNNLDGLFDKNQFKDKSYGLDKIESRVRQKLLDDGIDSILLNK